MLGPSAALIISITLILVLIRFKVNTAVTVLLGAAALSLFSLPFSELPSLLISTVFDYDTVRLLIIIAFALTLASLMERGGMLTKLATAMENLNPKLALHLIPAVIGLVPMPAGALVSAAASKDLAERTGLNPEQKTFINYWFRHIWEFGIPIYPSIILLSTILAVSVTNVTLTLIPVALLAAVLGAFFSWRILRSKDVVKGTPSDNVFIDALKAAWPILVLVVSVLLGLEPFIAFPLTVLLLIFVKRYGVKGIVPSLKYGFHPKIMLLLFAVMFYQAVILKSGAVDSVFADMNNMGLPPITILIGLPFIIAAATGISMAFTGITFPLLVPFIVTDGSLNAFALIMAYASGMTGMLLSPVHLCFVMSVEYFRAEFAKVYRYLMPLAASILAVVISLYLLFGNG